MCNGGQNRVSVKSTSYNKDIWYPFAHLGFKNVPNDLDIESPELQVATKNER